MALLRRRPFFFFLWLLAAQILFFDSSYAQTPTLWREGDDTALDPELERLNRAFIGLAQTVQPGVVQIRGSAKPPPAGTNEKEQPQSTRGSGMIINPEGYILTAYHVIDRAEKVEIRLANRQRLPAKIVATEPQIDIAVLKVESTGNLPAIAFGDSTKLRVGELVAAVTYPFGRESSLSIGIVSRHSNIENDSFGFDFIQTDTSVGPGASGGPLVNMRGHTVGMITMASQTGNMGFAVPISVIKKALPKLLQNQHFAWGWLGVKVAEVTMDLAKSLGLSPVRGVVISTVLPDQPAAKNDLRPQDIVLAINGVPIDSPREFTRLIGGNEAGKEVTLTIFRKGKVLSQSVLLGAKPTSSEGREG